MRLVDFHETTKPAAYHPLQQKRNQPKKSFRLFLKGMNQRLEYGGPSLNIAGGKQMGAQVSSSFFHCRFVEFLHHQT